MTALHLLIAVSRVMAILLLLLLRLLLLYAIHSSLTELLMTRTFRLIPLRPGTGQTGYLLFLATAISQRELFPIRSLATFRTDDVVLIRMP